MIWRALRRISLRSVPGTPRPITRQLSSKAAQRETLDYLRIGKHTRVIYQGFTGRVATNNAKESLEWGTQVVGGVTPGKDGEHLGLPVCPSVRAAKERLKPDATAIFVPMNGAAKAIEEAIEAEIPLIVAVAEHIPVHDMLRVVSMLRTTSKSRLVGANSPGIIAPLGHCRIGFQPLPIYKPGHVGVIAKSGTLSYEAVGSLTRAGLGQSICIGAGGDIVCGTTLVDGFNALVRDPDTHAIVLVGEVGGTAEEAVAVEIERYNAGTENPKPIVALVGGRTAPRGRIMGHAGAFSAPTEGTADMKYRALEAAGAVMCDHPEKFGPVLKKLMHARGITPQDSPASTSSTTGKSPSTRRMYHTTTRPTLARHSRAVIQQRHLHIKGAQACDILGKLFKPQIKISQEPPEVLNSAIEIGVSIGRVKGLPITIYRSISQPHLQILNTTFAIHEGPTEDHFALLQHRIKPYLPTSPNPSQQTDIFPFVRDIYSTFADFQRDHEAVSITALLSIGADGHPLLSLPKIHLDDAAFRSAGRQPELFALRDKSAEDRSAVAAEEHGISYVTLHPGDPAASIGTIVNGAGLAMNTVDALELPPLDGRCVNFLDTGGKATAETVRRSFELVLADPRTKVIFVNIFGGLTDGKMIADGIILAFKEVEMRGVPVVVRLRGTNEEAGQKTIAESGLSLEAFDGFEEAARRVIELAGREGQEAAVAGESKQGGGGAAEGKVDDYEDLLVDIDR